MGLTATATLTFDATALIGKYRTASIAGVAAAQTVIAAEAKAICPRDTGRLADSIEVQAPTDDGSAATGIISTDVEYAPYVEYGTGQRGASSAGAGQGPYSPTWPGMVAQPYMRPALDTGLPGALDAMSQELGNAL